MRDDQLPSPGLITNGSQLRRTMANCISYIEVNAIAGKHSEAVRLDAFCDAVKTAIASYVAALPTNSAVPTISGTAQVGATLTAANGTWLPAGLTFTRQWYAAGVAIPGATATTYVPVVGDVGKVISVRVTGSNVSGSLTKTSANTAAVIAA